MPNNKNQHFVPKVYLKAFASDGDRKRLNVWLHKHDQIIVGASIKNQCSKAYFYGHDLVLEELLKFPEQFYAKVKNKILKGEKIENSDLYSFLFFWTIQNLRAERAIATHVFAEHLMREKILLGHEGDQEVLDFLGAPMTQEQAAKMALSNAPYYIDTVSDLKRIILYNESKIPFISSDNPAVSSNRLIIQRHPSRKNWGSISAGYYLYLPISPSRAFLAYDANVYRLTDRVGSSCAIGIEDVHRLNQLIYLNSDNCIFIHDECAIEGVVQRLRTVADIRPEAPFRVNTAILDKDDPSTGYQRFRGANDDEFKRASRGLLHLESRPPQIANHFPKLRYQFDPRYIDTHSGAGWLRYTVDRSS